MTSPWNAILLSFKQERQVCMQLTALIDCSNWSSPLSSLGRKWTPTGIAIFSSSVSTQRQCPSLTRIFFNSSAVGEGLSLVNYKSIGAVAPIIFAWCESTLRPGFRATPSFWRDTANSFSLDSWSRTIGAIPLFGSDKMLRKFWTNGQYIPLISSLSSLTLLLSCRASWQGPVPSYSSRIYQLYVLPLFFVLPLFYRSLVHGEDALLPCGHSIRWCLRTPKFRNPIGTVLLRRKKNLWKQQILQRSLSVCRICVFVERYPLSKNSCSFSHTGSVNL